MSWNVRKPTKHELWLVAAFCVKQQNERGVISCNYEDVMSSINPDHKGEVLTLGDKIVCQKEVLKDYYVTVIDSFSPDSPSYSGKIIDITWADCSYFQRLIYSEDKTKLIEVKCLQ